MPRGNPQPFRRKTGASERRSNWLSRNGVGPLTRQKWEKRSTSSTCPARCRADRHHAAGHGRLRALVVPCDASDVPIVMVTKDANPCCVAGPEAATRYPAKPFAPMEIRECFLLRRTVPSRRTPGWCSRSRDHSDEGRWTQRANELTTKTEFRCCASWPRTRPRFSRRLSTGVGI